MENKVRSLEDINQEYTNLCAQIGDMQHQITILDIKVNRLRKRLHELTAEADQMKVVKTDE